MFGLRKTYLSYDELYGQNLNKDNIIYIFPLVKGICQLQYEDIFVMVKWLELQFYIWEWLTVSHSPCCLQLISDWCSFKKNTVISVTEYLICSPQGHKYEREWLGQIESLWYIAP